MTRSNRPSPPCAVLGCEQTITSGDRRLRTTPEGSVNRFLLLCDEHWVRTEQGEPWLWDQGPGDPTSDEPDRTGHILMGPHLTERRVVVADQAGDVLRGGDVFSPQLSDRYVRTLIIEGRVFGSDERDSIEIALTPETTDFLRRFLGISDR